VTLAILVCCFVFVAVTWSLKRFGSQWEIRGLSDFASLPLILLAFCIAVELALPLLNGYRRYLEYQADLYGVEFAQQSAPDPSLAAAGALETLAKMYLDDPSRNYLAVLWFFDHPPMCERITYVFRYRPCAEGHSPRFIKRVCSSQRSPRVILRWRWPSTSVLAAS
jgi:STE24 endopeptidase